MKHIILYIICLFTLSELTGELVTKNTLLELMEGSSPNEHIRYYNENSPEDTFKPLRLIDEELLVTTVYKSKTLNFKATFYVRKDTISFLNASGSGILKRDYGSLFGYHFGGYKIELTNEKLIKKPHYIEKILENGIRQRRWELIWQADIHIQFKVGVFSNKSLNLVKTIQQTEIFVIEE